MSSAILALIETVKSYKASLIAVTKTRSVDEIHDIYRMGIKDFGENRVQELLSKVEALPDDVSWHMIGHLQKNKVKLIAPFVACIHSVDSEALLEVIDKEGKKNERIIPVLLQIKIAREETKYGMSQKDAAHLLNKYAAGQFPHINIIGFMGMASLTDNLEEVRKEFVNLRFFRDAMIDKYQDYAIDISALSMGMSSDFEVALEEGATMVRIGSLIFGPRN